MKNNISTYYFGDENVYTEKELCDTLKRILTPILILLGIIGNLTSIHIFTTNRNMRQQTTFRYLTYLSILDLLVLSFGYGHTLVQVYANVDVRLMGNVLCKVHSFLVYLFSHSSSLVLVCMSVDRSLTIVWPKYGRNSHARLMASKYLLAFILSLVSLANCHFILFAQIIDFKYSNNNNNNNTNDTITTTDTMTITKICYGHIDSIYFVFLVQIFPWIDMFTYALGPFAIMLVCSIIIIFKLYNNKGSSSSSSRSKNQITHKRRKQQQQFVITKPMTSSIMSNHYNRRESSFKCETRSVRGKNSISKQTQITSILLTTNFLFVSLVSPLLVMNAFNMLQEDTLKTTIAYFLSYANHGISCQKYRKELLNIVSRCCCGCIVSTLSTSRTNSHRPVSNHHHKYKTNERGHKEEELQQQDVSNLNSSNININELTIIPTTPHNPHLNEEPPFVFQYSLNDKTTKTKIRRALNYFDCFLLLSNQNTSTRNDHGEIVRV